MRTPTTSTQPTRYDKTAPRRLREAAKLTLQEGAQRARISLQALRYLEKGTTDPSAGTFAKLATAYGCSVDAFFTTGKLTSNGRSR